MSQTKSKTKKRSAYLYVRELNPCREDIDAYYKIAYGENLHKYACFFEARSRTEAEKRIQDAKLNYYDIMYGLFNKQNRLLGVYIVHDSSMGDEKVAEVHYFVAEKFQGRGYCAKGIGLLAELFADTFDYFRFSLRKENISSRHVQERIGSVLEKSTERYLYYKYCLTV